jgi:tripartite-type tricarboxylate transporter receptor subunit TctC
MDEVGRPWAEKVKRSLGTVIVENIGGASGAIGSAAVARAKPDGYTLLFGGFSTHLILPLVSKHPSYDPIKDFEPIALLASNTVTIVVAPSLPVRTLTELVDYAKSNPGKLSYGTPGAGTGQHIIGEQFKMFTGLNDIVHVPYRGVGALTSDFISGQIPIAITTMNGQIAELNASGRIRMLAVTSQRRIAAVPNVPTVIEAGLPGLVIEGKFALYAPAGTPRPIIDQIANATRVVVNDEGMQRIMGASGFEPEPDQAPETMRHWLADETARWTPIIKNMGLNIE